MKTLVYSIYRMRNYIPFSVLLLFNVFINPPILLGNPAEGPERWDLKMIGESKIWHNLMVNYHLADYSKYWPERKKALQKVINEYPESRWSDDAALLLAGGKASIENDIPGAIDDLRKIIENYPTSATIIENWHPERGCSISEAWIMWGYNLALLDTNGTVLKTYPFDRDQNISKSEREALVYFTHLEKYPQPAGAVALYVIAQMKLQQKDYQGAINELNTILLNYPSAALRIVDYEASRDSDG